MPGGSYASVSCPLLHPLWPYPLRPLLYRVPSRSRERPNKLDRTGDSERAAGASMSSECQGPWVWYPCTNGAVLQCSTCEQITVTGNINDAAHRLTPILPEGV